jgi:hypothetical protein
MPEKERYLIGPGLRTKLREVISRVDGMADGSVSEIPTRLQDMRRNSGTALRLGTFTGSWNIMTKKTVTLFASTQTASVINICRPSIDCGTATYTATKYVVFGSVSGTQTAVELTPGVDCTATCSMTIGGVNFAGLPSFDPSKIQMLGHDSTYCLKWFDITTCSTAT